MNKKKLLVVVDMQNDFIDGSLGSEDAKAIVGNVCKKIDEWDGYVAFTFDTHYDGYLGTVEGEHIPVEHCINETHGWKLNEEVEKRRTSSTFTVYKDAFGAVSMIEIVRTLDISEIQLVGLCTDICVVSNALLLRAAAPYANVYVDASCCAGTTRDNHRAALTVMKQCCVDVINDN